LSDKYDIETRLRENNHPSPPPLHLVSKPGVKYANGSAYSVSVYTQATVGFLQSACIHLTDNMADSSSHEVTMEDIIEEEVTSNFNNNNNNVENNNNNDTVFTKLAGRPLNIQVSAKVLFGHMTAISALNAERKKKPSPPSSPSSPSSPPK